MGWAWVVAQEKGWVRQHEMVVQKEQVKHPMMGVETINQEAMGWLWVIAQEETGMVRQREMMVWKEQVKHPVRRVETSWERTDMMGTFTSERHIIVG